LPAPWISAPFPHKNGVGVCSAFVYWPPRTFRWVRRPSAVGRAGPHRLDRGRRFELSSPLFTARLARIAHADHLTVVRLTLPEMMEKSVDFPSPFGPTSPIPSWRFTCQCGVGEQHPVAVTLADACEGQHDKRSQWREPGTSKMSTVRPKSALMSVKVSGYGGLKTPTTRAKICP
jgi:hypothetical protein